MKMAMLFSRLLGVLLLLTGVDNYELFQRDKPQSSAGAHHVAKKDLRVDLSVPSLGVVLSQRLHRKAPLEGQPALEVKPTSGATTENYANDPYDRHSPGDGDAAIGGGEVSRHRGRFGEGMPLRTRVVTFPTVHKHVDSGKHNRERAIMRQWKDLMGSHESRVRSLPDHLPPRQKVKRRAGDVAFLDRRRSSTPYAFTANDSAVVCNCSELLTNKTIQELLILVPTLSKTLGETGNNRTVITEVIRASLTKSVLVERIYEDGCRCSCNGTTAVPRPAAATGKTTTVSSVPPSTARTYSTIIIRPLPTTTTTRKITSTSTTPKSRPPPQEIRTTPPTTPPSPTSTAASRSSAKCPVRVFVKFPGEQLPARARDCRKLWLPENVSKEETFWECEDEASVECRGRSRITTSAGLVFLTRLAETSLATSRGTTATRTVSSTSRITTTRAQSTPKTSKSERTTLITNLHDCDDSAPPTTLRKRTPKLATTTAKALSSTGGWHLNVHIPFYTFRGTTRTANATHPTEAMPEKVRHRHYTTTVATKASVRSTTHSNRRSSLTTTHTTKTSKVKSSKTQPATPRSTKTPSTSSRRSSLSRPSTTATSSQTSKSTPRRNPIPTALVPGTLVASGSASASNALVCNGVGCHKAVAHIAENSRLTIHHHRSTHYHLHDDYDFVWARTPSSSPERPSRILPYRVRGSTAFPYPFREYVAAEAANDRYPILIATNTSAERRPHVHNSNERAFFGRNEGASSVRTSTARTTYVKFAFGVKGAGELEQQRLAYKGYYRNVASRDVQRRGAERAVAVRPARSDHVYARRRHRPDRVLGRAKHAQAVADEQLPPVKIDLLKSKISLNALVNKVKNSEKCLPVGCAENRGGELEPEGIVIRTVPAKSDEYEYYYVYYEDPPQNEPPNLAATKAAGKPEWSGHLGRGERGKKRARK